MSCCLSAAPSIGGDPQRQPARRRAADGIRSGRSPFCTSAASRATIEIMKAILGKLNDELLVNLTTKAAPFCDHVDVAIAYADGKEHPFLQACKEKGMFINFYGLLDQDGAVAPSLLRELLAWGPSHATAKLLKGNFHAKVIWWRGFGCYIGSANLTHKAWFHNVEAGVFVDENELLTMGVGRDLDHMFAHLETNAVSVIGEVVEKLERLAHERRLLVDPQRAKVQTKFQQLFGNYPDNPALTVTPPKGQIENTALKRFSGEWMKTLQLMRGLSKDFAVLDLRPEWVSPDAHPAIHFDQFLHAYYYDFVRGVGEPGVEDDLTGLDRVKSFHAKNKSNPAKALREAAVWWAGLKEDYDGEEDFIRVTGPSMQRRLSKESIQTMDLTAFRDAMIDINAFRMHARQIKNVDLGLSIEHHETIEERVAHVCEWLWKQRSPSGKTVRDVLEFVLWGATPADMEHRLWLGVWGDVYRIPHFGQSTLGEAVGWARPDLYPPRNNRTNKALLALGYDVKLFGSG